MTSVDKYVLIPFNKYQKLLKGANIKEPRKINPPNSDNYENPDPPMLSSLQEGRGDIGQAASINKEVSSINNSINTTTKAKTNTRPPPGIPSEEVKINTISLSNKSVSDKDRWLSHWEDL